MIEADPNRSYVVDVFEAGSNQKVRFKHHCPRSYGSDHGWHRSGNRQGKKIHEGQGKVRECYLESGKLRIWRKVRENWNKLTQLLNTIEGWKKHLGSPWSWRYFFWWRRNIFVENLSVWMNGWEGRLKVEARTCFQIWYFVFIWSGKSVLFGSGKSQGILKSDVYGIRV